MKKHSLLAITTALLTSTYSFAGGDIFINWANDGSVGSGEIAPFYADALGLTPLTAGTGAQGDGAVIQLIALQGGTNFVLATGTIGDTSVDTAGFFGIGSPAVASNILAGAVGSPLGVKFYNSSIIQNATAYGIVSNATILVPSPNFPGAPPTATDFGVEFSLASFLGARTTGGSELFGPGFYTDTLIVIPEPSTMVLVGMGVVGAWFVRRRKKS
ncbi:MAG: hypothetical protein PCFJNLEI_01459 [Verrucomicrobiae bacterium]|nr:hypothetical protein [Verrucomicrobiae bacterium]